MSESSVGDATASVSVWKDILDQHKAECLAWSACAFSCCVLKSLIYLRFPRMRRTPGWIIFRANLLDLVSSVCCMGLLFDDKLETPRRFNTMVVLLVCSTNVAAYAMRWFMFLYLLNIYRNPFKPDRHRWHIWFWVILVVAITNFVWVKSDGQPLSESSDLQNLNRGFFMIPTIFFFFGGGLVYSVVNMLVICSSRNMVDEGIGASRAPKPLISTLGRQRASRHSLSYFVLYSARLVIGVICIGLYGFDSTDGSGDPMKTSWPGCIPHLVIACSFGGPVFNFIGWVVINDVFFKFFGCLSIKAKRIEAPRQMTTEISAAQMQGVKEQGFKEELRFELIFNVARGLGQMAQEELMMTPMPKLAGDLSTPGPSNPEPIGPGHGTTVEMRNLKTMSATSPMGSFCSDGVGPNPRHSPLLSAARVAWNSGGVPGSWSIGSPRQRFGQRLPSDASTVKGGNRGSVCKVTHYRPDEFRRIRDAFGTSRAAYARSFPNDMTELTQDWRSKLKETVSEGASGCFFYRVFGNSNTGVPSQLIVKQISKGEKNTLMRILPDYEAHVRDRQGKTFICYFGLHSVPLSWTFSRRVYFVVMRNFLPAKTWLVFDLKGATANRRALTEGSLFKAKGKATNYGTLRDWEWLDIAMFVDLSVEDRMLISEMIAADARFLADHDLLDYSLLLGIHRVPRHLHGQAREAHIQQMKKAGGFVSVDRQKVYFFGIIDVLESQNVRWKLQGLALKTAYFLTMRKQASNGISALLPKDYAERFHIFLQREVLHCHRLHQTAQGSFFMSGDEEEEDPRVQRWSPLWERKQRGLIREHIEVETQDHLNCIQDMAEELSKLKRRIRESEAGQTNGPGTLSWHEMADEVERLRQRCRQLEGDQADDTSADYEGVSRSWIS